MLVRSSCAVVGISGGTGHFPTWPEKDLGIAMCFLGFVFFNKLCPYGKSSNSILEFGQEPLG